MVHSQKPARRNHFYRLGAIAPHSQYSRAPQEHLQISLAGFNSVASAQSHVATSTPRAPSSLVSSFRLTVVVPRTTTEARSSDPFLLRRRKRRRHPTSIPLKFPKSLDPNASLSTETSRHLFRRIPLTPFAGIISVVTSRSRYHNTGAALDDDGTLVRCGNYSVVPSCHVARGIYFCRVFVIPSTTASIFDPQQATTGTAPTTTIPDRSCRSSSAVFTTLRFLGTRSPTARTPPRRSSRFGHVLRRYLEHYVEHQRLLTHLVSGDLRLFSLIFDFDILIRLLNLLGHRHRTLCISHCEGTRSTKGCSVVSTSPDGFADVPSSS
ncbi:hypothetical protein DFP72DRAFT_856577 [Ephemerocybe angulata]|uniref:Uncharacterized protein n=1 Tax=Ephemerocybe angulata TaxID=980116 RepID=A0A8H6HGC2_9AGAR|nr:hypothetical protein DFP72DRAFT_856577 [Tulosesus angulatus]